MSLTVLVLHGPNLATRAREELNPLLQARDATGVTLVFAQANGEEGMLDLLHANAGVADAVVVNPGVLAPTAWGLAEALTQLALPAVEVLLRAPRGPSALTGVVKAHLQGGAEVYAEALSMLVTTRGVKSIGRATGRAAAAPVQAKGGKSIGRRSGSTVKERTLGRAPRADVLTREAVCKQLTARLQGTIDAVALARWARESYARLNGITDGAREPIEDALLTLMSAKADDTVLVALLARLQS